MQQFVIPFQIFHTFLFFSIFYLFCAREEFFEYVECTLDLSRYWNIARDARSANNLWNNFCNYYVGRNAMHISEIYYVVSWLHANLIVNGIGWVAIVSTRKCEHDWCKQSPLLQRASFIAECEVRIWIIEFSVNRWYALYRIGCQSNVRLPDISFNRWRSIDFSLIFVRKSCYCSLSCVNSFDTSSECVFYSFVTLK